MSSFYQKPTTKTAIQFNRTVPVSCPVKKDITQYPINQHLTTNYQSAPAHIVNYDNPLGLSKSAYAGLQNLLSLSPYHERHRLIDLCITLPSDLPNNDASRRLNSFVTNVLRPLCQSCVRITGRTQKGRIHYHIALVMAEYYGRRASGKKRLSMLRTSIRQRAITHGFGITCLRRVRDLEGYAIYLARHVDRSRLKEDRKLRRVSYSSNFRRVCMPKFSWTSPFASRWRLAVASVAERYGYEPSDASRKWIWQHYRDILDRADEIPLPTRDFDVLPRCVRWQDRIWTVLRLQEDPNLFALQTSAVGSERFGVSDPAGKYGALYSTITEYMWRRDLQRVVNAERLPPANRAAILFRLHETIERHGSILRLGDRLRSRRWRSGSTTNEEAGR